MKCPRCKCRTFIPWKGGHYCTVCKMTNLPVNPPRRTRVETTKEEVTAKVQAVLALMREEWMFAAMDEDGSWYAFPTEPSVHPADSYWFDGIDCDEIVSLPPFPSNWKDSLVRRA